MASTNLSLRHTYTAERAGVAAGRRREERDCPGRQLGIRGSGYRAEISRSQNKCRNRPCWHAPASVYTLRLDAPDFVSCWLAAWNLNGRACEPYYRLLACLQIPIPCTPSSAMSRYHEECVESCTGQSGSFGYVSPPRLRS